MTPECLHAEYEPGTCSGEVIRVYDVDLFECALHREAVMAEWAEQGMGFQRWFDQLPEPALNMYFGLTREKP